jgi:hypothetical protein
MTPAETIRRAIVILNTYGWCQGSNALDAMGAPVRLFETSTAGDARVRINPAAASFSIYGAVAKAIGDAGSGVPQSGRMWEVLAALAQAIPGQDAPGGTNHVHPLAHYNESMDRTKEEVIAFLEHAAAELEGPEDRLPPPPERDDDVTSNVTIDVARNVAQPLRSTLPIAEAVVEAPAGVVGQIGFPKPAPVPAEDPPRSTAIEEARLPPIDWS